MDFETVIEARNLEKIYGYGQNALRVLKKVSLSINRGEIVSIVGPSGAGKSTLLNLVGCVDNFEKGFLSILGRDVSGLSIDELSAFRNRHIGFIFQLHNLLPEFSAVENIMMPLLIRRVSGKVARAQAMGLLDRFNLADRCNHKPAELSGGECQRIAVARAIIGRPDIILADEPTGSLDSANSMRLTEFLFEIGKEFNLTILIVTHDMHIAERTEKRIALIDGAIDPSSYFSESVNKSDSQDQNIGNRMGQKSREK